MTFEEFVITVFERWPSLQFALNESSHSTADRVSWLPCGIAQWILENDSKDPLTVSEVEETISAVLDDEFGVIIDDGTVQRSAALLLRGLDCIKRNRPIELAALTNSLPAANSVTSTLRIARQTDQSESSDSDSCSDDAVAMPTAAMDVEQSNLSPDCPRGSAAGTHSLVDDEGWSVAGPRRNRKR